MSNVLMIPASGAIIFDSQSANSSIVSPLSAAPRLSYDNAGGLNITSYTTAASALDRFSVDGASGRLFSVSDSLTGSIFSVNDAAGLPIIEVESNLVDKITMGTYGSNALVINDTKVGMGTALPTAKLDIVDTALAGSGGLSGSVLKLTQTWNTSSSPTAITLNVTNSASGTASNLMDLQVGGVSKLSVTKGGKVASGFGYTYAQPQFYDSTLGAGAGFQITNTNAVTVYGNGTALMGVDYGSTNGVRLASHIPIGWTNSHAISNPSDLTLFRDTSNTLAQRNGINPQAFRLYNTYTDAVSAFERLNIKWDTGVLKLGTEKGSTGGIARDLVLETNATERVRLTSDIVKITAGAYTPWTFYGSGGVPILENSGSAYIKANGNLILGSTNITAFRSGAGLSLTWSIDTNGHFREYGSGSGNLDIGTPANLVRSIYTTNLLLMGGSLGLGTTTPNQRLTVSGNISATGIVYGDGSGLTNVGGSSPYTTGTGSFSITTVLGSNTASGYFASINGGSVNTASGYYSVINGGIFNTASGYNSTINSGRANTASGTQSIVNSGDTNTASGYRSAVINGRCNTASGACSTVINGLSSKASAPYSTVNNGLSSIACGYGSTVNNGSGNIASGQFSTVGNGRSNTASGIYSIVVNGCCNIASGNCSTVSNGYNNIASGSKATIINGEANTASGAYHSIILNGSYNTASNTYTTVVNGNSNTASGVQSIVVGGQLNTASGYRSTVSNGYKNIASGACSTVNNGLSSRACGPFSTVDNGCRNIASGTFSTVINGCRNIVAGGAATINNGTLNNIVSNASYATISNGDTNIACGNYTTITNGSINVTKGFYTTTNNGACNIAGTQFTNNTTVNNGCFNLVCGSFSTVDNGDRNTASGIRSTVNNGCCNTASGAFSTISNGFSSRASGCYSTVNNGRSNTASGLYSAILGGCSNTASGSATFILGSNIIGTANNTTYVNNLSATGILYGDGSGLTNVGGGGGSSPYVVGSVATAIKAACGTNTASGTYSTVSNGYSNTASGNYATILNGSGNNTASSTYHSTVLGGNGNTASGYMYSTVINGSTNTASGIYSTIINGVNNIACLASTYILGSGITTDKPNTTYVESLQVMTTGYLYMRDTATLAYRCVAITNGAFVIV